MLKELVKKDILNIGNVVNNNNVGLKLVKFDFDDINFV